MVPLTRRLCRRRRVAGAYSVSSLCLIAACANQPASEPRCATINAAGGPPNFLRAPEAGGSEETLRLTGKDQADAANVDSKVSSYSADALADAAESALVRVVANVLTAWAKPGARVVLIAVTNVASTAIAIGEGSRSWVDSFTVENASHGGTGRTRFETDTPRDGDIVCAADHALVIQPGGTVYRSEQIDVDESGPPARATLKVKLNIYDPAVGCARLRIVERKVGVAF
jgi:hypothetical protein